MDLPSGKESRPVFRGEQFPSTPSRTPTRSILASIVGRKTATYTVTPPPARRELKLPRPCSTSSFDAAASSGNHTLPRSSHSSVNNRGLRRIPSASDSSSLPPHPVMAPLQANPVNCQLDSSISFASEKGENTNPRESSKATNSSNISRLLYVTAPTSSCKGSQLGSVEKLIQASCNTLFLTEAPQCRRSLSWVSLRNQPNNLTPNSDCSPESATGTLTPSGGPSTPLFDDYYDGDNCLSLPDCGTNPNACFTGSRASINTPIISDYTSTTPTLPPMSPQHCSHNNNSDTNSSYGKRFSILHRSLSNREKRHADDTSADNGAVSNNENSDICATKPWSYNTASLGRPRKHRPHLTLQDNVQQYKSWLRGEYRSGRMINIPYIYLSYTLHVETCISVSYFYGERHKYFTHT